MMIRRSVESVQQALLDQNGLALWLWFEITILTALIRLVLAIVAVDILGLVLGTSALAAAAAAYYLRGRAGWIEVKDDSWEAFSKGDTPKQADVSVKTLTERRRKSVAKFEFRCVALTLLVLGLAWVPVLDPLFLILGVAASTLGLFANCHLTIPRFFDAASLVVIAHWAICAAVTMLVRSVLTYVTAVKDVPEWAPHDQRHNDDEDDDNLQVDFDFEGLDDSSSGDIYAAAPTASPPL